MRPGPRLGFSLGFATDVGRIRQRNEDSFAIFAPYPGEPNPSGLDAFLAVADGMGGERAGDVASQLAAGRLREWLASGAFRAWPEAAAGWEAVLRRAVRDLSEEIRGLGERDPSIRGLGSTLVLVAAEGQRAIVAHVGDSRCYRVRAGTIELLTRDHSWVERQVEAGILTPQEARDHPQKNVLTRSLGDPRVPLPDVRVEPLLPGDVFLLSSDGLTNKVGAEVLLEETLAGSGAQALAERLVRLGVERDGSDNVTAVVGICREESDVTLPDTLPGTAPPGGRPRRARAVASAVFLALAALGAAFGAGFLVGRRTAPAPVPPPVAPAPRPTPMPTPEPALVATPSPSPSPPPALGASPRPTRRPQQPPREVRTP